MANHCRPGCTPEQADAAYEAAGRFADAVHARAEKLIDSAAWRKQKLMEYDGWPEPWDGDPKTSELFYWVAAHVDRAACDAWLWETAKEDAADELEATERGDGE